MLLFIVPSSCPVATCARALPRLVFLGQGRAEPPQVTSISLRPMVAPFAMVAASIAITNPRPTHAGRIRAFKNPRSRNSVTSLCPGEIYQP